MSLEPFKVFCPYQLAWGADRAGVKLAEKSRRIGWTYFDAFDATISRIGSHPDRAYDLWYSATDMTAAEEYIGYVSEFAAMVTAVAKISDGEEERVADDGSAMKIKVMRVTFDNGLRITAGSSNPKFFRSKGGEVKLDELAFHNDGRAMVKAALSTARFWGYPLAAWSSHNGENSYFNSLLKSARSGDFKASVHSVNIEQAVEQGIVERIRMRKEKLSDIPAVDETYRREWLAERRAECVDEDMWNEEYMCRPSSDVSSLLTYDLIRGCERDASELPIVEDPNDLKTNAPLYVGMDVGRQRDLTVFWALARVGDVYETRLLKRFSKTDYTTQLDFLNLLMSRGVRRACIDSTGIGNMLAELAVKRWGSRVEAVHFTADVKAELAMPLVRLFQDRLVRIPAEAGTREGLHKVRKIVTAAGNVRFDARHDQDGHADEFWALALAYHAADRARALPAPSAKPIGW